jgi:hypothetical protein
MGHKGNRKVIATTYTKMFVALLGAFSVDRCHLFNSELRNTFHFEILGHSFGLG